MSRRCLGDTRSGTRQTILCHHPPRPCPQVLTHRDVTLSRLEDDGTVGDLVGREQRW